MTLPTDVRKWPYYPIYFPLNKNGDGPETRPEKVRKETWEVWNQVNKTMGSYDCLPDAINKAMELTLADPTGEHAFD